MPAEPFELEINEADLRRFRAAMARLAEAGQDLGPAMALVAAELVSQTERRFAEEGPDWPDLAASTLAARARSGHWPGKKEQVSGGLAASTVSEFGPAFAKIGQSKVYAAIQNLGGTVKHKARETTLYFKINKQGEVSHRFVKKSKSNFAQTASIGVHETTLPPRPSLPITTGGGLLPEAEQAVLDEVLDYFRRVVGVP